MMDFDSDNDVVDTVMIAFAPDSDSDDHSDENLLPNEEEPAEEIVAAPRIGGGSLPGRGGNIERQRVFYSHLLYKDFWGPLIYLSAQTSAPI